MLDNRDIEEQLDRRSSSPAFSSVSSATKSGSNKQYVIIQANAPASGPSDAADIYEETRTTLSRATNFAELSKLRETFGNNSAINIVYMQNDKDASSSSLILSKLRVVIYDECFVIKKKQARAALRPVDARPTRGKRRAP